MGNVSRAAGTGGAAAAAKSGTCELAWGRLRIKERHGDATHSPTRRNCSILRYAANNRWATSAESASAAGTGGAAAAAKSGTCELAWGWLMIKERHGNGTHAPTRRKCSIPGYVEDDYYSANNRWARSAGPASAAAATEGAAAAAHFELAWGWLMIKD